MAKTKSKARETEVDEAEDMELEELDEDVEEDEAPAKSKGGQEVTFGVSDLAKHLSKITGKTITPRELRTLIRKMAREDKPRVNREITAGNRTRYDWPDGLDDPEVKIIVKAVTKGELEEGKREALAKLKERKAEKAAAGEKTSKSKKGKKAKAKVEEPEDDEEIEEIDEDELEADDDE